MTALIVVESHFGNSRRVADAIASGIADTAGPDAVRVWSADQAPPAIPAGVSLLIVGSPTHAFSLPNTATRTEAAQKGATEGSPTRGVREWIAETPADENLPVFTFDTSIKVPVIGLASAAKAAAKALRKRGFGFAEAGQRFYVKEMAGPLLDGELDRARAWGAELAGLLTD